MEVKVRHAGGVTIFDWEGALVVGDAERVCRESVRQQMDGGARRLAINLSGVPYMDSSGMSVLVRIHNATREAGSACRFYGPTKKVVQLLRMVRLDKVLELTEDESSVLASL